MTDYQILGDEQIGSSTGQGYSNATLEHFRFSLTIPLPRPATQRHTLMDDRVEELCNAG